MRLKNNYSDFFSILSEDVFRKKRIWTALAIFLAGVCVTVYESMEIKADIERQAESQYLEVCREIENKVASRLRTISQILRSSAAYIENSEVVTRDEWRSFFKRLNTEKNTPGMAGLAYSRIVEHKKLKEHERQIRLEGYKNYKVHPENERSVYVPLNYLEPITTENSNAFGYDMYSDPVRRKAMDEACDSDIVALTGKVKLCGLHKKTDCRGIILYAPVYRKDQPAETPEERRRNILGWVSSPLKSSDFMPGFLSAYSFIKDENIRIELAESESFSGKEVLFDNIRSVMVTDNSEIIFSHKRPFSFNNKTWQFRFTKYSSPSHSLDYSRYYAVLFVGICFSLTFLIVYLSMVYSNVKAKKLAEYLTRELRESELQFKSMFDGHTAVMLLVDPETENIIDANRAASAFYGYSPDELKSMTIAQINTMDPEKLKEVCREAGNRVNNYYLFDHRLAGGEIRKVEVYTTPIASKSKALLFSIVHDITERKNAEEKIKELLREKELLLKEVHHRIKNNMVAVIGLLRLQQYNFEDGSAVSGILEDAVGRIQSMSVLYDKLYRSADYFNVDAGEYIKSLVGSISRNFPQSEKVKHEIECSSFELNSRMLQRLGIIINELLTNIYKYAFEGREAGTVRITLKKEGRMVFFSVHDDGIGISNGPGYGNAESFGLTLIKMLSEELRGELNIENLQGTRVSLRFEA